MVKSKDFWEGIWWFQKSIDFEKWGMFDWVLQFGRTLSDFKDEELPSKVPQPTYLPHLPPSELLWNIFSFYPQEYLNENKLSYYWFLINYFK